MGSWFSRYCMMAPFSSATLKGATADAVSGDLSKEALDHVKPGRRLGREVQVEAQVCLEPAFNGRGLMRGIVTDDEVKVQPLGGLLADQLGKAKKLPVLMAWHTGSVDVAIQHVEHREQPRGARRISWIGQWISDWVGISDGARVVPDCSSLLSQPPCWAGSSARPTLSARYDVAVRSPNSCKGTGSKCKFIRFMLNARIQTPLAPLVFGDAMGMPLLDHARYAPTSPRHRSVRQSEGRSASRQRYGPVAATPTDVR